MRLAVGLGDIEPIAPARVACLITATQDPRNPTQRGGGVCVLIVVIAHFLAVSWVAFASPAVPENTPALCAVLPDRRAAHPARHGHIVGGGVREGLRREFVRNAS